MRESDYSEKTRSGGHFPPQDDALPRDHAPRRHEAGGCVHMKLPNPGTLRGVIGDGSADVPVLSVRVVRILRITGSLPDRWDRQVWGTMTNVGRTCLTRQFLSLA